MKQSFTMIARFSHRWRHKHLKIKQIYCYLMENTIDFLTVTYEKVENKHSFHNKYICIYWSRTF